MANIEKKQKPVDAQANSKPVCKVCGEAVDKVYNVHCFGNSQAFGAQLRGESHHARFRHLNCPVCGADMGCPRCSGIARELLCVAQCGSGSYYNHDKAHWGSSEALAEHGDLILDPAVRKEAMAFLHRAAGFVGANPSVEKIGKHHGG